ncbi:MAG: hypothetical protein OEY01_02415 [Desulfobulbaceae bacterium]|nr:hypothetical protein [Desulfobulbaceae bacterium]
MDLNIGIMQLLQAGFGLVGQGGDDFHGINPAGYFPENGGLIA